MSFGGMSLELFAAGLGAVVTAVVFISVIRPAMRRGGPVEGGGPAAGAGSSARTAGSVPRQEVDAGREELAVVLAAASHFARLRFKKPVCVKIVTPVWDEKSQSFWLGAGRQEIINAGLDLRRAQ